MHCNGFWATLPFSPSQAPWMLRGICARARSVTDRCFWRRWPGPETHPLHPLGSCSPGYSWGWHEKRAKEHKITSASALCVITAVYNEPEVNYCLLQLQLGKGLGAETGVISALELTASPQSLLQGFYLFALFLYYIYFLALRSHFHPSFSKNTGQPPSPCPLTYLPCTAVLL